MKAAGVGDDMRQLPLPMDEAAPARARGDDPETSHEAAAAVDATARQRLIYATMLTMPNGATCGELALRLHMPRDSISPRMRPMVDLGLIRETDERRALPGGRAQIVWRLKDATP